MQGLNKRAVTALCRTSVETETTFLKHLFLLAFFKTPIMYWPSSKHLFYIDSFGNTYFVLALLKTIIFLLALSEYLFRTGYNQNTYFCVCPF
jgi:hypothetical protein